MSMLLDWASKLDDQFSWLLRPSVAVAPAVPNLFVSDMPDTPDFAVALYQYGGEAPEQSMGTPLLIEKPRLQVVVRSPNYKDAADYSYQIFGFLGVQKEVIINGTRYLKVTPVSSPEEIGPDQANRQRIVSNYSVWKDYA